ncbi:50S ribosomal protein L6 [Thiohalorhabdus denitrificans]|uniref:Large ribosomal subunit protein uL6 n=1 Tax=Thiohalorhabdus denitrificans TaxID=381306 RepID=A0A0P9CDR6_9GAMM|nr:50S ribosomal protein L6 [Thiohalorhabdus denitrificans]KPV40969.1 50S ribosomal protein L6 [Thiohalorhabdus denitrificans]SCY43081.1 LSU ribosomal protein L6P [Thiohalorhabdus denitrificans]
MSRIANAPVRVPEKVEVKIEPDTIRVTGPQGELEQPVHPRVRIEEEEGALRFRPTDTSRKSVAFAGTMRSLVNNMVTGVNEGFERRLEINGVGYRADAKGQTLNLQLGFSHPVAYEIPEGVSVSVEGNAVVVRGASKEAVGQVAADIRSYRPPEPYKGKGIRLADERIIRKEAKKK